MHGWIWIACHILAFIGAFSALLLTQVFDLNKGLEGHYVRTDWKVRHSVLPFDIAPTVCREDILSTTSHIPELRISKSWQR